MRHLVLIHLTKRLILVVQYSRRDLIEQEAPHEIPDHKPPPEWPSEGAIEFKGIRMSYRAGLPEVLKGLSD